MIKRIALWALGLLLAAFFVFAMADGSKREMQHHREQIAECRALGGFAHTTVDGWFRACTFPAGRR